jgi:tetratricopeptide (TPR) repeat protein
MSMSIEDRADDEYWHAGRLLSQGKTRLAYLRLLEALEINPSHEQAAILLGEMFLWHHDELQAEMPIAHAKALELFEEVLRREPRHAEAWSQKGLALLYLERYEEALEAAERGLEVLPSRVGYAMSGSDVYTNVTEALYDRKIRALLELERRAEAFDALSEGLRACPESEYLTRLIEVVSSVAPTESR